MTRKRILLGFGAIVIVLAGFGYYELIGNPFDPIDRGKLPIADEYLGKTKTFLIWKYGSPSKEWSGHYANPPTDYIEQHKPAITISYERFTGVLYVSFERKGDEWICFSSHWLPKGWAF
jgi:hypothetical protein